MASRLLMVTRSSRDLRLLAFVGIAVFSMGCSEAREQKARCNEAVKKAQASLKDEQIDDVPVDLTKAREDIDAARAVCPEKQQYLVERLDKTLAIRQKAQRDLRERRAAEAEQAKAEPLVGFVAFVAKHRDAAERAAAEPACHPRTDPGFGFCEGSIGEGPTGFTIRFWKDAPKAFRFSTRVPTAARCDDLGLNRVVRNWKGPGGESRAHCEIYGGVLEGLWALVTVKAGPEAHVEVFSREYLKRDDALRQILEREGR